MTTTKKINHGSVKLTRENITQGRLGEKIRSISGSDKVLSQDELISAVSYTHLTLPTKA